MIDIDKLLKLLLDSLESFCKFEGKLLVDDTHEDALTTGLIVHLYKYFTEFGLNIDGQYDQRIIDNQRVKKKTDFLIAMLPGKKLAGGIVDEKFIRKEVLPDIIIHDRDSPDSNLLAIEVKKSSNKNKIDKEYDYLKLSTYTSGDLNYEYGAFIQFNTGKDYSKESPYSGRIYIDGVSVIDF